MLIKKPNEKWCMCVDYMDLNMAFPIDNFPFPHIYQLVDSTSGYELRSFLNAYLGNHQVRMAKEDRKDQLHHTNKDILLLPHVVWT